MGGKTDRVAPTWFFKPPSCYLAEHSGPILLPPNALVHHEGNVGLERRRIYNECNSNCDDRKGQSSDTLYKVALFFVFLLFLCFYFSVPATFFVFVSRKNNRAQLSLVSSSVGRQGT